MIVVTGAGGKTGRAVIAALARASMTTRALVRRPSQIQAASDLGAVEVTAVDFRQGLNLRRAMANARAVYHIGPNVHPQEIAIGRRVIAAARQARVEHFVLHSVLHPQAQAMAHHWRKLRLEETLLESSLDFTILQPAAYMQNLLAVWAGIIEHGILRNPYPADTRLSLVDLEDVAAAAAVVLASESHLGATYELVGTQPLSQFEVAAVLSKALGRPVRAEAEPVSRWETRAARAGLSQRRRQTLVRMFRYYRQHGLVGNPNVLGWLLGRDPVSLEQFARRTAAAQAPASPSP